jgi:hypothetical protein
MRRRLAEWAEAIVLVVGYLALGAVAWVRDWRGRRD